MKGFQVLALKLTLLLGLMLTVATTSSVALDYIVGKPFEIPNTRK